MAADEIPADVVAALEKQLRIQEAKLLAELDQQALEKADASTMEREVHDRGEESVADSESSLARAMTEHYTESLVEVRAALHRIEVGAYGRCARCDEPIELNRLTAYPSAVRCLRCQAEAEG